MIFNSPVYPIAPSFNKGNLDTESTSRYVSYLKNNGAKVIMSTAGTSQFNLLDSKEIRDFNSQLIEFDGKKIIGIQPLSFHHMEKEIMYYNSLSIDSAYLLVLFPDRYYNNDQILDFFSKCCSVSNYPILAHGNTIKKGYGGDFFYDLPLLKSLSTLNGFIGIKEESPSLDFAIKNLSPDLNMEIIVAGGSMRRFWTLEPFGATSYLAGVGSFNPAIEEDFYSSYMIGDKDRARDIMIRIENPLFENFMSIGWHASMRYALSQMGYIKENRDPFYKITNKEMDLINSALKKILK